MKYYIISDSGNIRSEMAVMGMPMSLFIMLIISCIVLSLFAVSSTVLVEFNEGKQIENSISEVCETVSVMSSYACGDSQVTMTLSFPSTVECVIFGSHTKTCSTVNDACSSSDPYCVFYQTVNGHQEIYHCPVAFCNATGDPLVLSAGTYVISFSLKQRDDEVYAVGIIR
jgi:hypothetical protein